MAYVNPGNRATTPVPRAGGPKPPTVAAPRYAVNSVRARPLPVPKPPVRPPVTRKPPIKPPATVRKPPAGTRTASAPSGGSAPTSPYDIAKQLTDQQYAGQEFGIQQAIQRSQANYQAALASLHDWGQQIQANWKKYSGLTNQAFSGAVAGQEASDANISNLFGESNAPQAASALEGNATELRALGADQSAFSSEMGPILQQAQMDLAGRATHDFSTEQQSLNDQFVQLQAQKANDYVKNYQDIQSQAADIAYKNAQLANENTRIKLEQARLKAQQDKNAGAIAPKDKFTQKIDYSGNIIRTYADGRIVNVGRVSTRPASTGSWTTKYPKDGSVIQTNSKTGAVRVLGGPGTIKAPKSPPSQSTINAANTQHQKTVAAASTAAEKWYNGVQPATDAQGNYKHVDKNGNPTDGVSGISYQDTLNRLKTKYPGLTLKEREGIANQYYKPGEDGRPFLSFEERQALAKAGVKQSTIAAATWDKHNSEVLKHNYPGVIAKANANPKQASGAGSPTRTQIIQTAKEYIGTAYHYGGASPETGFDCSGLLVYAFGKAGINLPHNAAQQFHMGQHIDPANLQPGDAVFFITDGTPENPGHVGIYLGNGKVLTAPHTGAVVHIDLLAQHSGYVGARRYI